MNLCEEIGKELCLAIMLAQEGNASSEGAIGRVVGSSGDSRVEGTNGDGGCCGALGVGGV